MNRQKYFNFIEEKLILLATRLKMLGGLNILDMHLHTENFYLSFFNLLFGWELKNLNAVQQNAPGIDLLDSKNKIVIQVSATATKQKIESALNKDLSAYKGYYFKFISICKDAEHLRSQSFLNPHKLTFSAATDIFDVESLLLKINAMNIDQIKSVYEFLKKELKNEPDPEKVESNLTTIINILSKENWRQAENFETAPYDIEAKIEWNQLVNARAFIDDYKIHYSRIDKIYQDFDKQGANKSLSVLDGIRAEYVALGEVGSPDQRFLTIIDGVIKKIQASLNYEPIAQEELEMCVRILVVDAFIRCKIFKNPLTETNAHP